jgi:hypothetical protein
VVIVYETDARSDNGPVAGASAFSTASWSPEVSLPELKTNYRGLEKRAHGSTWSGNLLHE